VRKYLLDTNVCADYLSGRHPEVVQRMQACRPGDLAISSIVESELRYGVQRSAHRRANHARLESLLGAIDSVPFDSKAAVFYGKIRSVLEASGTPIGPNDLLIAAHALALELVLVTDNVAEFGRVASLKVENWRTPAHR
jgi:tRNA(fMet)-specific endonuclease VapC